MPTSAAFLMFVRGAMGVPVAALADTDPSIAMAYQVAVEIAFDGLAAAAPATYDLMVYNLAADALVNLGQDVPGGTFFSKLRTKYGCDTFAAGVVQGSSDEGSSTSLMVPDVFKAMTMADLSFLKTPWGRQYLALAMRFGSLWGIS